MYNSDKKKTAHAVALFSGGLDSTLAILLMLKQDIEVTALYFMTHFGCDVSTDRSSCGGDPYPASEKFGFKVKLVHLGQKFIDIVERPKYGYGKNMNPCLDCRLLMLREAKDFMDLVGADFIVTGEVMGQRPKSQLKDKLRLVEKQSGIEGRLLRPLSAKLLPETIPEKEGLVDRKMLEGISGRSRKRQMELAKEFGLDDYPSPAAGCLLTDPGYSTRLRDLLTYNGRLNVDDINLLKLGRHFRLDDKTRLIVGKNKFDNDKIEALSGPDHIRLEAQNTGSPVVLLIGEASEKNLRLAASITARYSRAKNEPLVEVAYGNNGTSSSLVIEPASPEAVKEYHIV